MDQDCVDEIEQLMSSEKYEHAMVRLQPHVAELTGSVQAWWLAANCLCHLKQYREAVKYCEKILACEHDHRDALLLKGYAQFEDGCFAESVQTVRSTMHHVAELSFDEQWPCFGLLGAAEYRNGAYSEAADALESSLQSWAIHTAIMLLGQNSQPESAGWNDLSDDAPCVLYALSALNRWPPGPYCEATEAFREVSEFGEPDGEEPAPPGDDVRYFYDEVLNDLEVRRIVLPQYLEAFRAKCHDDEFYIEILAYRAKALLALEHEDAAAYCEEVRLVNPKLLEEE